MPGLLRGVARTAVIAGTATATSNAVNRRQAQKNVDAYGNAQQQYSQQTAQPAPAMAVASGPAPGVMVPPDVSSQDDMFSQLERLGQLKAQGILTEEEFAAQKAKILAG
ncbi:MAG TPA: SHOCT domain-containing protein [Coriobacteriia bacterium]|nr:SHOCT domain-containing protein [Coriobacteriia bacterium]